MLSAVDAVAIILALVSLTVTVLGFFASLRFYRDGMELQQSATRALAAIEEKAGSIQSQVGSMFERTLDAAISRKADISDQYEDLLQQLDETTKGLVEDAVSQIGAASETEKERIAGLVESRMSSLEARIASTQRAAERWAVESPVLEAGLSDTELRVLKWIGGDKGMSIGSLGEEVGVSPNTALNHLRSLSEKGLVQRIGKRRDVRYSLTPSGHDVVNFSNHD